MIMELFGMQYADHAILAVVPSEYQHMPPTFQVLVAGRSSSSTLVVAHRAECLACIQRTENPLVAVAPKYDCVDASGHVWRNNKCCRCGERRSRT